MSERGKTFGKSVTKQAYTAECDINRIMRKFQKTGTLSHIAAHNGYADMPEMDYEAACLAVAEWDSTFASLPSEVRKDLGSPAEFQRFVMAHSDEEIVERLPQLAELGDQWPSYGRKPIIEERYLETKENSSPVDSEGASAPEGGDEGATQGGSAGGAGKSAENSQPAGD